MTNIGSYVFAHHEVDLLIRLENYGLLPSQIKRDFIHVVVELAIETPDADFLIYDELKIIFNKEDLEFIKNQIKGRLIDNLERVIKNWKWNYYGQDDPEDYYFLLIEALKAFIDLFEGEKDIIKHLARGLKDIEFEIDYQKEMADEEREEDDIDGYSESQISTEEKEKQRSIFDDVDE